MSRIRTVKPELFLDEDLGRLTGDHLALFVGLWTLADRDGRLEDRPARIKASLFPYREVDVAQLLRDLDAIGKVVSYEDSEGRALVCISGFAKHQRPHPKETASTLEAPPIGSSREKKRLAVERLSSIPSSPPSKGREGKEILESGKESSNERAPTTPEVRLPATSHASRSHGPGLAPPADSHGVAWLREQAEAGRPMRGPPPGAVTAAFAGWIQGLVREGLVADTSSDAPVRAAKALLGDAHARWWADPWVAANGRSWAVWVRQAVEWACNPEKGKPQKPATPVDVWADMTPTEVADG